MINKTQRSGFSLLEVAIASVLLAIVMGSIGFVAVRGMSAFNKEQGTIDLEVKNTRTINYIAEEFLGLRVQGMNPVPELPFSSAWLEYRIPETVNGNDFTWSSTTRVEFVHAPEELDDGLDNNGNGLVDEGVIQIVRNVGEADESTQVLKRWVREYLEGEWPNGLDDNGNGLIDEQGLSFSFENNSLTIHVTVEKYDENGELLTKTVDAAVRLRN